MRTTPSIDHDALSAAKELARRHRLTLGQAVSELVRRGARQPLVTRERNGLTIVALPEDSPQVTAEQVGLLAEDLR